ncbi:MAG: hypothetical protein Q9N68_12835, partial [Gammaproteobacteria bacterium]|nr:hypothetical protein [Gammaproteobacteria bacterium]
GRRSLTGWFHPEANSAPLPTLKKPPHLSTGGELFACFFTHCVTSVINATEEQDIFHPLESSRFFNQTNNK